MIVDCAAYVRRVVDDYRPALDGFERDVLDVEREVFAESRRRPVQRLYHLERQMLDQLGRIVARARNLSDLITTAIDANLTQVSLQQNEDTRRISAYVALAALPTLIVGIYGMNFKELHELEWEFGYPAALRSCGVRRN